MTIREKLETEELARLSPYAVKSACSQGRQTDEPQCTVRTDFQRDVDRIIHSKSFRRLKQKTQVFFDPEGDHYRTRMTHTIEVSGIARTIARALWLNEDLTEAISLGHDLGHTPFGHSGERAMREITGHFEHNEQSLRAVDRLEKDGEGLNLTYEVRMGILTHTGEKQPETLEAKIVRYADKIAYINHDIDDSIRAGILSNDDIPREISDILGNTHKLRIDTLVRDVITASEGSGDILMTPHVEGAMKQLRTFMFEKVYHSPVAKGEETKVTVLLQRLYEYYLKHPEAMPEDYLKLVDEDGVQRVVCDYVAGMSDKYAAATFTDLFVPYGWSKK